MPVIVMETVIEESSILYTVWEGMSGVTDGAREIWRKEIWFGRRERFRAGGAAFVEAAREQAEVAERNSGGAAVE